MLDHIKKRHRREISTHKISVVQLLCTATSIRQCLASLLTGKSEVELVTLDHIKKGTTEKSAHITVDLSCSTVVHCYECQAVPS
mgnify:CR=1 FL=1